MSIKDMKKSMKKNLKDDYIFLDEDGSVDDVQIYIPSGCTALDYAMTNRRNGGFPVGKIIEVSGMPHSGKSLMAIHACAEAQKMGGLCVYLDPENAFNDDFAKRVGLNIDAESFWRPEPPPPTIEALFSFLFDLGNQIEAQKKDKEKPWPYKFVLVVWDSVASSSCKADLEAENPDPTANVGLKPRIISKNMTTFLGIAAKKDMSLLCLNQLRTNIRAMPGQDPYVAPGGNAIPFYASIRLRIKSVGRLKVGDDVVGVKTEVEVKKTRFGPPFRKAIFPIYFTHGIDDPESIINSLEERKGVTIINGGPKGKLIALEGQDKDSAIKKSDFKRQYLSDQKFREKILDLFEKVMTRDLNDPRFQELTVDNKEDE